VKPTARPRTAHAVVALGITQIIGWGTTFYLPATLSQPIADEIGLSNLTVLGAYCWAMLISGFLSRRIGQLIDRYGAALLMSGSSVLTALALLLLSSAHHAITVWAAWTLIGLAMRAMLYDGAFAALAALEGASARRAISLLTLFGGLASTVFWPISYVLLEAVGWRETIGLYALLNLLACAPLHYFFAGCLPSVRIANDGKIGTESATTQPAINIAPTPAVDRDEPIGTPCTQPSIQPEIAVFLLATAFAFHAFIWSSLAVHLPALLDGFGVAGGAAVAIASLMGPAQVVSRSAELFAQRWLSPLVLTVPVFAMLPLSLLPLAIPGPIIVHATVFVLVYGLSNGLLTVLRGALPLLIMGPTGYGELLGRIAAPSLVVSAVSPLAFGQIMNVWGPQVGAILLFVAGVASTLAAAFLIRSARRTTN
jgi:hypothetical protein